MGRDLETVRIILHVRHTERDLVPVILKVCSALIPMSASVVLTRVTEYPVGTFSGMVDV